MTCVGSQNPILLRKLFQKCSQAWEDIARNHIRDIWNTTKIFLNLLVQYLLRNYGDIGDNLIRDWIDPIMKQRLKSAEGKLEELLEVHKDFPFTINPDKWAEKDNIFF